ncbi:helix-turn-helix DNA binding domain protein [Mycobacterium phage Indlovu]|nr:helix-turn-helix DNA binding domain protein [Mycobacterium phage Indlovu]
MRRRDQNARDAEIRRLAALPSRLTNAQIARQVRCSETIVSRVRREAGLAKVTPPLTAQQLARAECLLADGCSRNEVARTLGVSSHQLRRAFPEARWSTEERVFAENDTGQRARTSPQLHRSKPRGWQSPTAVEGPDQ